MKVPVAPPRGKEGKQSVAEACGVPDDALSPLHAGLEVDGLTVRKLQ